MTHPRTLTPVHWGVYEVEYDAAGLVCDVVSPLIYDLEPLEGEA